MVDEKEDKKDEEEEPSLLDKEISAMIDIMDDPADEQESEELPSDAKDAKDDKEGEDKDGETGDEEGEEDPEKKDDEEEDKDKKTDDEDKDDKEETAEEASARYKLENEKLREQVNDLSAPKDEKKEDDETKKEKPEEIKVDEVDFVKDIDMDELTRDPAEFNKLLNSVYSQGIKSSQEGVLKGIPTIVSNNVKTVIALREASDNFYKDNEDLAPFKKVVALVFEETASEHPDWKYDKVLEESGTEARKRLELHKNAVNKDKDKDTNKDEKKDDKTTQLPRKRGQQKRESQAKPDTDPLLDEIDQMNEVVN